MLIIIRKRIGYQHFLIFYSSSSTTSSKDTLWWMVMPFTSTWSLISMTRQRLPSICRVLTRSARSGFTFTTTSGDIELHLPENSVFTLAFDTGSGDLRNDFAGQNSAQAAPVYTIQTSSGAALKNEKQRKRFRFLCLLWASKKGERTEICAKVGEASRTTLSMNTMAAILQLCQCIGGGNNAA